MPPSPPLLVETLRGLGAAGPVHRHYVDLLWLQAAALLVWWPKDTLAGALEAGRGPYPALAVVAAFGATLAYHALRAGAEEIRLPGQQSLREWALATPVPVARLVAGWLAAHLVQALGALAVSSPLLLAGFAITPGPWGPLAWSVLGAVVLATCYRLLAALVYLAIGHRDVPTFLLLRLALVAGYALPLALLPAASHPVLAYRLLHGDPGAATPDLAVFLGLYGALGAALLVALHGALSRLRRRGGAGAPARGGPGRSAGQGPGRGHDAG